jgi:hypothetical protein
MGHFLKVAKFLKFFFSSYLATHLAIGTVAPEEGSFQSI